MRLTTHILDQISWWEHTTDEGYYERTDVFTLHFKAWWRFRKVIRIPLVCVEIDGDTHVFIRSRGAQQLLDQLNTYLSYPETARS